MEKKNILAIFANHTSSKNKYNISLNNISIINKFVDDIIVVDSIEAEYSNKLKNDIKNIISIKDYIIINNDKYFDFGKWIYVLENFDYSMYNYIVFINDSIIITSLSIKNYFIYLNNLNDVNLYGYNDSSQIKYHYQSYFFSISVNIVNNFISFFHLKKDNTTDLESLIYNIELNICEIDIKHNCFLKISDEWNLSKNLYWENEGLYSYLLIKDIFSLLKLKKIYDIQNNYKINIYNDSINDFDYTYYRNNYDDLINLSDNELLNHFLKHGQYEGRKYKNDFNVILPYYYREKLENIGLLYFFDVPYNFDLYYYRLYNNDISKLSNIELLLHYVNIGLYENRKYSKNKNLNNKFNDYYKNIIYQNINFNIKVDDNFDILQNNILFTNNIINNNFYCGYIYLYIYVLNNNNNKNNIFLPDKFNYDIYKNNYDDLINLNNDELKEHYLNTGIFENRIYSFDIKIYNKDKLLENNNNCDINSLTNNDLEKYYNYDENYISKYLNDFDYDFYRNLYKDLYELTNDELKNHYINHGIKENRIYKFPNDFNHNYYRNLYKDLNELTNDELEKHYIEFGIRECRVYK